MTTRNAVSTHEETQKPRAKASTKSTSSDDTMTEISGAMSKLHLPQKDQLVSLVKNVQGDVAKALRENPALLPAATGAIGFAVGLLAGSKLSRILLLVGVGAAVSELVKGENLEKIRGMLEPSNA